jgi:streptomycin 6-kinase
LSVAVPTAFRRNILELHGTAGADWLERIPELLETCASQWSLSLGPIYSDASYSYVLRVVREDGVPGVLKLSFPGDDVGREASSLQAFGGRGAVALLAYDAVLGALLLSRAEPGDQLARLCEIDDEQATSIAAGVVRGLLRPAPTDTLFPSVDSWPSEIERLSYRIELRTLRALASDAASVAAELCSSPSPRVLLHGDLHQFNILSAGSTWLAIDPKGVIGEQECEIGPLLLNPIALLHAPNTSEILGRRLTQLCAELALDPQRAHAWAFVRAVLAVLWAFEDHDEVPAEWIACSQLLRH